MGIHVLPCLVLCCLAMLWTVVGIICNGRVPDMDAKTRLLAVEVLLTDPEELRMDPLEADLYELRDRLRGDIAEGRTS